MKEKIKGGKANILLFIVTGNKKYLDNKKPNRK